MAGHVERLRADIGRVVFRSAKFGRLVIAVGEDDLRALLAERETLRAALEPLADGATYRDRFSQTPEHEGKTHD